MFKGTGISKRKWHKFSSGNGYHELDGLKLEKIELHAALNNKRDVQELIDFLEIAKFCMK